MKFIIKKEPPIEDWCLVKAPNYCPSGYVVAKWTGDEWLNESDEVITDYVEGWHLIES